MSVQATRRRERAFEEFARRVEDELGETVSDIILFGSTARGEATETSDLDVLLVMKNPIQVELRETVSEVAFDVGLDYDVAVTYILQSKERFDSRQSDPFIQHVRREGRPYG